MNKLAFLAGYMEKISGVDKAPVLLIHGWNRDSRVFNKLIPENAPDYTHVFEGDDDMPAHLKSALTGVSLNIPIQNHQLALGIWQGIYLCEFRNNGGRRNIICTILN